MQFCLVRLIGPAKTWGDAVTAGGFHKISEDDQVAFA